MQTRAGFTLIEISIVLVIIGLITGGVLVGRDLIEAAKIRAQITQIERFKTAVQTFRTKYNALPGDLDRTDALAFGFADRAGTIGHGNGNGILEYCDGSESASDNLGCETVLFWRDLSDANLIEGSFTAASDAAVTVSPGQANNMYIPDAKVGVQDSVVVFSIAAPFAQWDGAAEDTFSCGVGSVCYAIFSISNIQSGQVTAKPIGAGLTPQEAFAIDSKIDDGIPTSGSVYGGTVFGMLPSGSYCDIYDEATGCSPNDWTFAASFYGALENGCLIVTEPSPGQYQTVYATSIVPTSLGFKPQPDVPSCILNISGQ